MGLIVSADEHLVEPEEFWNEWLPQSLPAHERDRAPRVEKGALYVDGAALPTFLLFPELIAYSDAQPGVGDIPGRLAMMDQEGIDVSILFPQRALGMFGAKDREFGTRCFTAYNEYLAHFCKQSGGRLIGVATLPTVYQPEATADYLAHLKQLGFRMVQIPNGLRGASYTAPEMAPLWQAIEESGMVVSHHTSETPDNNGPGGLGTWLAVTTQPFRKVWAHYAFSGLYDRYPGLRMLFAEGGISWIPSALYDCDRIYENFYEHLNPKLPKKPSEYWHSQCYATFMDDPSGVQQIDLVGIDRVLWSSDYPHPEGTRGRTQEIIRSLRSQLGEAGSRAVLGGNAAAMLGLSDRLAA